MADIKADLLTAGPLMADLTDPTDLTADPIAGITEDLLTAGLTGPTANHLTAGITIITAGAAGAAGVL